jgi:hypothetical protein
MQAEHLCQSHVFSATGNNRSKCDGARKQLLVPHADDFFTPQQCSGNKGETNCGKRTTHIVPTTYPRDVTDILHAFEPGKKTSPGRMPPAANGAAEDQKL